MNQELIFFKPEKGKHSVIPHLEGREGSVQYNYVDGCSAKDVGTKNWKIKLWSGKDGKIQNLHIVRVEKSYKLSMRAADCGLTLLLMQYINKKIHPIFKTKLA